MPPVPPCVARIAKSHEILWIVVGRILVDMMQVEIASRTTVFASALPQLRRMLVERRSRGRGGPTRNRRARLAAVFPTQEYTPVLQSPIETLSRQHRATVCTV